MKHINNKIALVALVLIGLVFVGCQKYKFTNPENIEKSTIDSSLITVKNSMLYFPNMETFLTTKKKWKKKMKSL